MNLPADLSIDTLKHIALHGELETRSKAITAIHIAGIREGVEIANKVHAEEVDRVLSKPARSIDIGAEVRRVSL